MPSPNCTVNGSSTTNGVNVAKNTTVTIALADTAGVNTWSLRCLSTDELLVADNITAGLSINSIAKTATFTSPNTTSGAALIFESKVNGGLDVNGRVNDLLTTRFAVFVPTDSGSLRVGAFDETIEGNASFGWTAKLNAGIRAAADAALTPVVTGTLPIVVTSPSAVSRVISINPAVASTMVSPGSAGSLSANDKAKLNEAASAATASTLMMRDGSGGAALSMLTTPSVQSPTDTLSFGCTGFPTMTLDGNATNHLLVPFGIESSMYKLDTQQNLSRSIPLAWSACKVSGSVSWSIDDTGNLYNDTPDGLANLNIECDFVNGCHITGIVIRNRGAGGGGDPLPQYPPSFSLYRKLLSTGANTLVGTVNATLDGTYRGNSRDTTIDLSAGVGHIVDSELYRYFIVVTPEFGTDSLAGCRVYSARVDHYLPVGFTIGLG